MPYTYEYPHPAVTVDLVVFGINLNEPEDMLKILLIERAQEPYKGFLALPGGFVEMGEGLEAAARRELQEETGVEITHLEQLYTFGEDPNRDPRERIISVAYYALVRSLEHQAKGSSDAKAANWMSVNKLFRSENKSPSLAFDHRQILTKAFDRLRAKIRYEPIGFSILPKEFSMAELRGFYEALLGEKLDSANFRKKIIQMDILKRTRLGARSSAKIDRKYAVELYQFDEKKYNKALSKGLNFEL